MATDLLFPIAILIGALYAWRHGKRAKAKIEKLQAKKQDAENMSDPDDPERENGER